MAEKSHYGITSDISAPLLQQNISFYSYVIDLEPIFQKLSTIDSIIVFQRQTSLVSLFLRLLQLTYVIIFVNDVGIMRNIPFCHVSEQHCAAISVSQSQRLYDTIAYCADTFPSASIYLFFTCSRLTTQDATS